MKKVIKLLIPVLFLMPFLSQSVLGQQSDSDISISDTSNTGEIYFIVDEMPKFNGGTTEKFREWIATQLVYPAIAAKNGISGRVFVQFIVNPKGKVTDVIVVRGVDPALDKEALRVVRSSPDWEPGKQKGKPVSVQFTFPIIFILQ